MNLNLPDKWRGWWQSDLIMDGNLTCPVLSHWWMMCVRGSEVHTLSLLYSPSTLNSIYCTPTAKDLSSVGTVLQQKKSGCSVFGSVFTFSLCICFQPPCVWLSDVKKLSRTAWGMLMINGWEQLCQLLWERGKQVVLISHCITMCCRVLLGLMFYV